MKAMWKNIVLAESDNTEVVEGNHYFPKEDLNSAYFKESNTNTVCSWKGTASYYSVEVEGEKNIDAAWFYSEPKEAAKQIKGMVAFWKGVEVLD